MFDYDIVVVGGGPAGISAAINLAAKGKSAAICSNNYAESALYKAKRVDNYPGLPGISGAQLLDGMARQVQSFDVKTIRSQVLSVAEIGDGFYISAGSEVFSVKAVILATGVVQTAFYPGETQYLGRGVSYCATCDGMLYRGRKTAVIGLRNDAVEEANQLLEIGCEVVLIMPNDPPEGIKPGVEFLRGRKFAFSGDEVLRTLTVDDENIPVDGVFIVRASVAPDLLMPELSVKDGYIVVNEKMETNIAGVFAAGDCTGRPYQISKASGQGQVAAFSAASYIERK
ncbi:MAG: NAD(P)/FAD-dependent oxidoreductase [Clostridiales bacterium]|jgi:thioredoxin reductase (NADPH)|nr:NAD(P)/FAD-dependent oxidoreductase [Clostridiales bacterium]